MDSQHVCSAEGLTNCQACTSCPTEDTREQAFRERGTAVFASRYRYGAFRVLRAGATLYASRSPAGHARPPTSDASSSNPAASTIQGHRARHAGAVAGASAYAGPAANISINAHSV